MKSAILKSMFAGLIFMFFACGDTDTVESGTYQGTVDEVEPEKTEIYVKTDDDKTLELYFTDETVLSRAGNEVDFSELQKGQKVEVEVEKVGKRLDPLTVKILD
ncbi:hypothetical protein [Salegentibacter sp.]|uniref:hypothetical protein n=1 Tax=Salegentibacter sp. TaxID=1903072 RepID=UPI00356999C2